MLMLLLSWSLLYTASNSMVEPYSFAYPSFNPGSCNNQSGLICMGSIIAVNGTLDITPEADDGLSNRDEPITNRIARVLHGQPVLAWPASISVTFTIRILKHANSSGYGDGMAFIMAQDNNPSPSQSFGSYMGIFDQSTQGGVRQFALEMDTFKNEYDPDDNHIAIVTISISNPVVAKSLNSSRVDLKSGRAITFNLEYNGWTKNLQINVGYAGEPLVAFLDHTIVMEKIVPSNVYVGFTAATGTLSETHQLLNWNFTSTELPRKSLDEKKDKKRTILIVVPIIGGLLILLAFSSPFVLRARRRRKERIVRKEAIEMLTRNVANAPKMFTHRQLSKATQNFSEENLLGTGGFGSVYKGVIPSNPPKTIAVKRISATSSQGEKEYLAEICTIGSLRHKNLLPLLGWCHEREQLLLVYEYMPNGSLDFFIGKDGFLDWKTRHKVLTGLASALVYLHEECGNPVVHRDVKPNNIMLDSEYNAHLGDFGLARLLQNMKSVTTVIAGTPGYLAPEVSFMGKVTPENDVYSFGMVVLELVCGMRSKGIMEENGLVDVVWNSYEDGKVFDCVDKKLEGEFDEEQVERALVVGLACLHPDYNYRPKMRKVAQIFMNQDEPLMGLPVSRPTSVCVSFNYASPLTTVTTSTANSTTQFGSRIVGTEGSLESLPHEMTVHDTNL